MYAEAQLAVQLGMPGRCAQGEASDVPLFESLPVGFRNIKAAGDSSR